MVSLSGMGVFADGAILTFGMQFVGFTVAAILQTEVFYDVLGGLNFLALAVLAQLQNSNPAKANAEATTGIDIGIDIGIETNTVFAGLFAISRGWLLVFLAWRAHHRKGDSRFDGVRDVPSRFFAFWMVQGVWVYCVSLPLLVVAASETALANDGTTVTATNNINNINNNTPKIDFARLMLLGMALSIYVEIRSDVVKAKWVSRGRPGGFCTDGLWNHSRHPNYAGEILTWAFAACYSIVIHDDGRSWQTILVAAVSPLFTMNILLNTPATGVWDAEGKKLKRYYEHADPSISKKYAEYRRTTPPVFPTFLVPYESIPLEYQRRFFFEREVYEYKPSSSSKGKAE